MSYSDGRRMSDGEDLLFRVRITNTEKITGKSFTHYRGPYTAPGPARSMRSRERKRVAQYGYPEKFDYEVEMEVCMPQWEVFE